MGGEVMPPLGFRVAGIDSSPPPPPSLLELIPILTIPYARQPLSIPQSELLSRRPRTMMTSKIVRATFKNLRTVLRPYKTSQLGVIYSQTDGFKILRPPKTAFL